MRNHILFLSFGVVAASVQAQQAPIFNGDPIHLIAPACSPNGRTIAFAAATGPDARAQRGTNLYLYTQGAAAATVKQLTDYSGDQAFTGVTSVTYGGPSPGFAGFSVLPQGPGGPEEVHVINLLTTVDKTVATDKEGCVQLACVNCFRACVGPVHLNADASKVLYAAARERPFYLVNADGSSPVRLPVFSGALAPAPQRVIANNGTLVFTSAAPSGPTFAAAATDVYTINLDGTGLKQVTQFGNANFFALNATISADASLIAFETNFSTTGPRAANQIWVVRPDGTGLRPIAAGATAATSPSISADGSVVTFLQDGQVKSARTANSSILNLTKLSTSTPASAAVCEEGAQVAFTLGPSFAPSSAAVVRAPTDATTELRNLTSVYRPRLLNTGGVASVTGYGSTTPGTLFTAYGLNLGFDELTQASSFPLPTTLGDLSVLVNNQAVPLVTATPWQINAQLPQTMTAGPATATVQYSDNVSLPIVGFQIANFSPSNFAFPFTRGATGYTQAAAFHAGTLTPADLDHPAAIGETLEIYGAGFGRTEPLIAAGMPSPGSPPARALQAPRVQIGGRDATVTFSGLVPGLAGVYQVNVVVPSGVPSGVQTIALMGDPASTIYSSIAIK